MLQVDLLGATFVPKQDDLDLRLGARSRPVARDDGQLVFIILAGPQNRLHLRGHETRFTALRQRYYQAIF